MTILEFVQGIANEGLHPSTVVAEYDSGTWQCRVVLSDWCPLGEGGTHDATVIFDRENLPDGVTARAIERFEDRVMILEATSHDAVESMIKDVAEAGKAPDVAWVSNDKCLTKPIEWLREPLRSALLRRQ